MADDRPRRRTNLLECVVRDELLVYSSAGYRVVALNPSAHAVWRLCDGQSSAAEIAATIGRQLGGFSGDALLSDVHHAIARLRDAGLIDPSESNAA